MPAQTHTVLVVDDEDDARELLRRSLRGYRVLEACDGAEALSLLRENHIDIVLSDHRMPKLTGTELLATCVEEFPHVHRVLVSAYTDLPEVMKARADAVVTQVMAKPVKPSDLRDRVASILAQTETKKSDATQEYDWTRARELLSDSIGKIIKTEGVIIRGTDAQVPVTQLQFVLPDDERLDDVRDELMGLWRRPIKLRGTKAPRHVRKHPVATMLGTLGTEQELLARELPNGAFAYIALLPWRREAYVTVAMGILGDHLAEQTGELLAELHQRAVETVGAFPLPNVQSHLEGSPVAYSPEYNWVVTKNYVGPDRRRKPTSFANRYVFVGRRKHVAEALTHHVGQFVDAVPRWLMWASAALIVMSLADTWLTIEYVSSGTVRELNPLWRVLLEAHPGIFLVGKNAVMLFALFVVVRWHVWRPGRYFLFAALLGYAGLLIYWAALLL